MKQLLKKIVVKVLSNDTVGKWSYQFSTFAWKIKYQRELIERKESEKDILELTKVLFKDLTVLHGPFKGMKYPGLRSKSSSLYSKLIGSYEQELHPIVNEIISTPYDQILDIGCAEGYYAVGLALKMPQTTVYAYDIDSEALDLTKKMAEVNKVSNRVIVSSQCDAKTLRDFKFKSKSLIISDTEGFEKHLFTAVSLPNLLKTDILIETHDFIDITISTELEKLFANTHNLSIVQSIGDIIKAKTYKYPELESADLKTKYRIFEEGRRVTDEWLYLKAKH